MKASEGIWKKVVDMEGQTIIWKKKGPKGSKGTRSRGTKNE